MKIIVISFIAVFVSVLPAFARNVYLTNGEVIEAQRVWQDAGMIHVLVNRDTLLDFTPSEVDKRKTFAHQKITVKRHRSKGSKAVHRKTGAVHVAPSSAAKIAARASAPGKTSKPALDQSPRAARLVAEFKEAYATGRVEELSRLIYWEGADDATRKSVTSTLANLLESTISNVYMERGVGNIPAEFKTKTATYRPNLKLIGFLKVDLREDNSDTQDVKTTSVGFPVGVKDGAYRLCTSAPVK